MEAQPSLRINRQRFRYPNGKVKSDRLLGVRQFLLRGLDKVKGERSLVTMAWNLFVLKAA